jgi:hypothetical protein
MMNTFSCTHKTRGLPQFYQHRKKEKLMFRFLTLCSLACISLLDAATAHAHTHATAATLREQRNLESIYQEIVAKELTMVTAERFKTIDNLRAMIYEEGVDGDIIECGCWRGGMSIYLAYSFPDRVMWVADSFQGFESLDQCKYDPTGIVVERHTGDYLAVPEAQVRGSFLQMGLDESRGVNFLPGWVNETTDPASCPVEKLALLRIDVDAYSATLVTLENLYDKVVSGGFIIFDDSGLYETVAAIRTFEKQRGVDIVSLLHGPLGNHVGKFTGQHGLYFRKP